MHYYLKINRNEGYSIRNLRHWIETINLNNDDYTIICDNEALKKRVMESIEAINEKCFIPSNRTDTQIVEITKNNTSDFWNNASYSHLTTFFDAKKKGLDEFWNIDADDTCFCMTNERVAEILGLIEEWARKNRVHAMSFDMSHSRRKGAFWTFGVTYTDNRIDWFKIMMSHCYDGYFKKHGYDIKELPECIDTFFTYISDCGSINVKSFYVENAKFVHYSNDFVYRPWCSWFATYKEGKIIKPLLRDFYGLQSVGEVDICSDVVKFDINLSNNEQAEWLINKSAEFERNKNIMRQSL